MTGFDWTDPLGYETASMDDERALSARAHSLAKQVLKPRVKGDFLSGRIDPSVIAQLGAAGFLGLTAFV